MNTIVTDLVPQYADRRRLLLPATTTYTAFAGLASLTTATLAAIQMYAARILRLPV